MMEVDMLWGGEHKIQYTDDEVLQNCTPEIYIILLNKVILINWIKNKAISVSLYLFRHFLIP